MNGLLEGVGQYLSTQGFDTLVWEAALLACVCAGAFLWAVQARRNKVKVMRARAWEQRQNLRSRGA